MAIFGNKSGTTTKSKMGKIGLFMRNIASDKTIIMKNMTKNQGIFFPPLSPLLEENSLPDSKYFSYEDTSVINGVTIKDKGKCVVYLQKIIGQKKMQIYYVVEMH